MRKKWIVMPSLLLLTVIGATAMPGLQRPWQASGPQEEVVDRAMRAQAIDTLVAKLNDHYVFPDKAREIEAVLRQRQSEGTYEGINNGYKLARRLTADVRGVARDLHMEVRFAPKADLPGEADGPAPASWAQWWRNNVVMRTMMRDTATRGMARVGRLDANVGYLRIAGFPDVSVTSEKFAAIMNELADTDGLIVDLRRNRGGDPRSAALLVSYFVDQRTRLNDIWDRTTGNTTQYWTQDKLDGKRYGGRKPVLILAGPGTASAGEDFAYTMQALSRATVIGERTWGGAHPARPYRLVGHFYAVIPGARSISPISGTNWEGVGVVPDITAPGNALATARKLMRHRLHEDDLSVATTH